MAKISLTPNPTFDAIVPIPVPGAKPAPVRFTFKHRTRDEVTKWWQGAKEKQDSEMVADCLVAWELDDEFNRENIERLCNNYAGAAIAILEAYAGELRGAREKN